MLVLAILLAVAMPLRAAEPLHFPAERRFDMQHIRLELAVNLEQKRVSAVATLRMTPLEPAVSVRLDAVDLDVRKIAARFGESEPRECVFANDGKHLEVYFGRTVAIDEPIELRIVYVVQDPDNGLHFFTPNDEDPQAPYQVWSQGESEFNRYWFPCFDNPNEMQTTEILATVDKSYQVLSNGRLVGVTPVEDMPDKVTYHWVQEQPHVSYLVSLVVGRFAIERDTWRGKPVEYYVPPQRRDEIRPTFKNTTRMLEFFSERLGVEYPWVKYAQVCCYQYGGGMENTSATTLGERALHSERARIDSSPDGLLSHELAHQWFGDLVTCKDWAHIWLNEGFASYFEALWDEYDNGPQAFAYNMYNKAQAAMGGDKDRPIVDRTYPRPDAQFDARAYPKGAWVLHMLRRRLGDKTFFGALNAYLTRYAHRSVETADLRRTIEDVTGRSFERFFYDWTQRPGHPVVEAAFSWDEERHTAEVRFEQTQEQDPFEIPLVVEFWVEGRDEPVRVERRMRERECTVLVPLPQRPRLVRIDPEQAVLMDLKEDKPRDLWLAQLHDDPNPAARIRAVKHLSKRKTDANRRELADALEKDTFWGVQEQIAEALGKLGGDIARDALLRGLQSDNPRVRRPCVSALAAFEDDAKVQEAVAALLEKGDESDRVLAAAARTYGKLRPDDALRRLKPLLERESHRDQVRVAALEALGDLKDPAVLDVLVEWLTPGRPLAARRAAMDSAARIAALPEVDETRRTEVVEAIAEGLSSRLARTRAAAAGALRTLGGAARDHLERLRELASDDPSRWVRRAAERAAKAIEEDAPAREQIADLRKQLDELREQNKRLAEQVEALEARSRAYEQIALAKRGERHKQEATAEHAAAGSGPARP